jgi:hypothetical protein
MFMSRVEQIYVALPTVTNTLPEASIAVTVPTRGCVFRPALRPDTPSATPAADEGIANEGTVPLIREAIVVFMSFQLCETETTDPPGAIVMSKGMTIVRRRPFVPFTLRIFCAACVAMLWAAPALMMSSM